MGSYREKLLDARWQRRRLDLLSAANFICQGCGAEDNRTLHVHHSYYETGIEPWNYPLAAYLVLCATCHDERSAAERRLLRSVNRLCAAELDYLAEAFECNTHGFAFPLAIRQLNKDNAVVEALFLNSTGNDHVAIDVHYTHCERDHET